MAERLYVAAEGHLLASGKRDSANLLAEMLFDWYACALGCVLMPRSGKGIEDPAPYAVRGTLPYLNQSPPNILPALTFLTRFLSLLSSSTSAAKDIFVSTIPSQTSWSLTEIHLTTSPTLNFLQLALITIQRAPAPGVSAVQARGTDGGVARDWEGLVNRYTRSSGSTGIIGQKEVQEVR